MSETDRLIEMGIDSVRAESLADAYPAPKLRNGKMRISLRRPTGEWLYSFCSAHYDYERECPTCHKGVWGW